MPDSDSTHEKKIQGVVALLKDRTEEEREGFFGLMALTTAEQDEVKRRLRALPRLEIAPEKLKKLREMKAFQGLVQDVRRGKAILFVGAGVSQDAGMPSSGTLVDALLAEARAYRIPIEPDRRYSLPEVAGLMERAGRRQEIFGTLKKRIEAAYQQVPPPYQQGLFRLLPYLGELNRVILTTNWDELNERALSATEEPVVVIRRDKELALWAAAPHAVVKLHGDFTDPDTLVVSDTDYERAKVAITRPGGLAGSLWGLASTVWSQYSCIFVGYRLGDPDINLLRLLVASRQMGADVRNYMVGPFNKSEQQGLRDWANMEVIPVTASEFFVALAQELAEFANRRDDLERIFRLEARPFLEFYAPFGAGKGTLLDEMERQARSEGWMGDQIIRVDLKQVPRPLTVARLIAEMARAIGHTWIKRGEDLAQVLSEKKRVFILLEHTEAAEEDWPKLIEFVAGIIAPVIRDLNKTGLESPIVVPVKLKSRLILSGRYPVEGWSFAFKRDAEVFPLSPFSLSAVREMVGKYVLFYDPQALLPTSRLVQQIYDVTGCSNPGFVKAILDDLMKKSKKPDGRLELPPALTEQEIVGYLASFEETIRKEVWAVAMPDCFKPVEALFSRGLCMLRRLNLNLLAHLAESDIFRGHFSEAGGPEAVLGALKKCRLLTYEFPLEVVDPVIRRIQGESLWRKDKARLASAHKAAASAWQTLLSSVADQTYLVFFREWLYHQAFYLQLDDQSQEAHWQTMERQVAAIPFRTSQPYPMGRALLQAIEEKRDRDRERDEELLGVLLGCLGQKHYELLREQLIAKDGSDRQGEEPKKEKTG